MIQKSLTGEVLTEEGAVEFLKKRGYSVVKQCVSNLPEEDLVTHFYTELRNVVAEQELIFSTIDSKAEVKAIKRFAKKAARLSITKETAYGYLKDSITLLFKYWDKLGLRSAPSSLEFLLSTKGSWIFKKVNYIHSTELESYKDSIEFKDFLEDLCNTDDERFLELQANRHNRLLGRKVDGTEG